MSDLLRGSQWNRWDLHFHTPSSYEYVDNSVSNSDIVEGLVAASVRVVAITDHHVIDVSRVKKLQEIGQGRLTVLPGIELRTDQGGQPIHYICIFPENCNLDHVWTTFQGKLGLTSVEIERKGGNDRIYVPIAKAAPVTQELGGIITIHAGTKTNSIENIKNSEQFLMRIKFDITKDFVHFMEIGQIKDINDHINIIFPKTGLDKPLILCSDNHNIRSYSPKANMWICADPTFKGLQMVIQEPRDRVFIGDRPPALARVEQNKTKYIRRVSFSRKDGSTNGGWFSGGIDFNHGLVAIVGNKGSGKSALADTLGLLGSTKKGDSFSFLCDSRFRHAMNGYANLYEATLEWESGETVRKSLADKVSPDEVERVKYLPQDHVEKVCNEIAGGGEVGFDKELQAVIFSHVPETERLGLKSLEELVQFKSGEKQKRIDTLQKQLRELGRSRAALEDKKNPAVRRELEEKVKRKQAELSSHEQTKPQEVQNPMEAGVGPAGDPQLLSRLHEVEEKRREIFSEIDAVTSELSASQRRLAVASRLVERLDNFSKEFESFCGDVADDASELEISTDELIKLSVNTERPSSIRTKMLELIEKSKANLDSSETDSLKIRKEEADRELAELQSKLDAPHRAYQNYLKALEEWEVRGKDIVGTDEDPDSLTGLQASLRELEAVPQQVDEQRLKQVEIARQILAEKMEEAEVYRVLYQPVQQFISTHVLAKDKFKLEFRAELVEKDFVKSFLSLLSQSRKGSFMGLDEGRARAEELVSVTNWNNADSVSAFLNHVDVALHTDLREEKAPALQLKTQLVSGKKPEHVFDFLYGLEYVRPRYVLRWEDKDLSMLSPGERGTLLLVFYLLIDKGDMPLVIDQPEGNLDNHTVAKMLVDCIKEARNRRQVFIVTHNPNLAVVCDANQVIHASMDKEADHQVTYTAGALENVSMSQFITDVLEGTRWAFGVRGGKYKVAEELSS